MLAITSDEFQTLALGWLSAVTVVGGAILAAILKFWPQLVEIRTRLNALHERQDRQTERQNTQEQTVAQVALAAQPPAPVLAPYSYTPDTGNPPPQPYTISSTTNPQQ